MNLGYSQERKDKFEIGDLVCYENSSNKDMCGIITEIKKMPKSDEKGEMIKVYWCIDNNKVDISPLSYPPVRKNGWIAAGLLMEIGNLKIVSKKTLDKQR
tara:strand:+ start:1174 stop:1473 length:300 start_codon:yes stop_codon:yes gene_type:complete